MSESAVQQFIYENQLHNQPEIVSMMTSVLKIFRAEYMMNSTISQTL